MYQSFITVGMLAGGLGLFMLAVSMISDGLRLAAGHALRDMLGKWTKTPKQGIITGLTITAIVQSSSAVTVATIGFVNAGLINMYQALGVVYGANIGTTMTGWLVAIVGFKINIDAFALPIIGIGMILRLTGGESRRASLGFAMAGFGLFFIGIDVLKEAFEGLASLIDLQKISAEGISGILLFVGIGFMMTVLTQSSSAAIAITLTAATGGILNIEAAAAMVIGANVGTTSTAGFAVIGATPNAKRVAAVHVVFNLVTGVVALILLPVLFWVISFTGKFLGLEDIPAVTLAIFHTVFNILGVLIMWPLSARLTRFLESRFVTQEETESRPKYLDKTVAVSPMLALHALVLELTRISAVAQRMAMGALSSETAPGKRLAIDYLVVEKLSAAVANFITRLERGVINAEISRAISKIVAAEQHLLTSARLAFELAKVQSGMKMIEDEKLIACISKFRSEVVGFIELCNLQAEDFSFEKCKSQLQLVQISYEQSKDDLLNASAELRAPVPDTIEILEQNSRIRRMSRQIFKAVQQLNELYGEIEVLLPGDSPVNEKPLSV